MIGCSTVCKHYYLVIMDNLKSILVKEPCLYPVLSYYYQLTNSPSHVYSNPGIIMVCPVYRGPRLLMSEVGGMD